MDEERFEFVLLGAWAQREFGRSVADRRPLKGQTTLFPDERAADG
jgi:hypothetical protein